MKTEIIEAFRKELKEQAAKIAADLAKQDQESGVVSQLAGRPARKLSEKPTDSGIKAARWVRALAASKGDPDRAVRWAEACQLKSWRDTDGDDVVSHMKAVVAGQVDSGGFLIPEEFSNELIELLYAKSVVRRAGPINLPLINGSLTIPRETQAPTATYVGESQNIPTSDYKGDQQIMTARKLTSLVPISNDLLSTAAGASADMFVRNAMVKQIAIREDQAFLRGDGTQSTPKGIRYWTHADHVDAIAGTTSANIEADFEDMLTRLDEYNLSLDRVVMFMSPRTKNHLMMLREGTSGDRVFPGMASRTSPSLLDIPVFVSTNIPVNLGGGSNESEIIAADMDSCILAEQSDVEVVVDGSASYDPGSGLVSAFQRDETLVRAITRHDFALVRSKGAHVYTGVTY